MDEHWKQRIHIQSEVRQLSESTRGFTVVAIHSVGRRVVLPAVVRVDDRVRVAHGMDG